MTHLRGACAGCTRCSTSAARGSPTGSFPYPTTLGDVAAVPEPARLGRLRGLDLLHDLARVLVRRARSPTSPRSATRPRRPRARIIYGIFSLGWRGSARHWRNYEVGYLLLAGLSTPLVVSVHTIVSFDFAMGLVPGWHSTIFPPFFVAGRRLRRLRHGVHADRAGPAGCSGWRTSSRTGTSTTGQGDADDRPDRGVRVRHSRLCHGLVQREPVRAGT